MKSKKILAFTVASFVALQSSCPVFAQNKGLSLDNGTQTVSSKDDSNRSYLISKLDYINSKLGNGRFYVDPDFDYDSVSRSSLEKMIVSLTNNANNLNLKTNDTVVQKNVKLNNNVDESRTLVDLPPYCVDFDTPAFWGSTNITGGVYLNCYRDGDDGFKIRSLDSASTWVRGLQFPITFSWDCRFIDYGSPYDNGKKASLSVEGVVTASLLVEGCPIRYDYTKKITWVVSVN